MTRRNSNTAFMRPLRPITSDSIVAGICDVMTASRDLQGVELGNLGADRRLDAVMQRHMRRWATGAHADETHRRRSPIDAQELDVPAVRLKKRPHAIEDCLNPFLIDGHVGGRRNPHASAGFPECWRIAVSGGA